MSQKWDKVFWVMERRPFTVLNIPKNIAFIYRRPSKHEDEKGEGWGKGIE